jgi:hypothetical protein
MKPNLEQILSKTPGLDGFDFDPRALIRTVNVLQPLGKEGALNIITEFHKKHYLRRGYEAPCDGMFLVLRCLFDVPIPPGFMLDIGYPWVPPEPSNQRLLPRIPLVILGDVPLMFFNMGGYAGPPPNPLWHVDYFRNEGRLRPRPLIPTNHPGEVMAQLESLPQWLWGKRYKATYEMEDRAKQLNTASAIAWELRNGRQLVRPQLLRLLASAYSTRLDPRGLVQLWEPPHAEAHWQKIVQDVSRLKLRWDDGRQDYVRVA